MNDTKLLEVKDLKKYFTLRKFGRKNFVKAVDGVSFHINQGEILGILGESGCGKSTLGLVLSRIEKETEGDIIFKNKKISGSLKLDKQTRRDIQIILQNPYDSFDPRLTIQDSLIVPLKIHGIGKNTSERRDIILDYLHKAGFEPASAFLKRYPHELSGGQLQRISVLRAMILKPSFLIADECVSMLDLSVRASVINLLLDLTSSENTSMMFITHDISLGKFLSDRLAVIYLGKIVELGNAKEVSENPLHPYTKILISYSPSVFEKKEKIKPKEILPTAHQNMQRGCNFASRCPFSKKECFEKEPELFEVEEGHWVSCLNYKK
jgi:peptide/nickel transport system ATP-binding protein